MTKQSEGIQWKALAGKLYNGAKGTVSWLSSGTKNVAGKAAESEVGGKVAAKVKKGSEGLGKVRKGGIGLAPAYALAFGLATLPCCGSFLVRGFSDSVGWAFSGDNTTTEVVTHDSDKQTLDILTDGTEVTYDEAGKCIIEGINGGEQYRIITEPGWGTMFGNEIDGANASLDDGIELLIENALLKKVGEDGETRYILESQGLVSAVEPTTTKLKGVEAHVVGDGYNVFLKSNGKKINLGNIPSAQLEQLAAYDELNGLIGADFDTVMRYVETEDGVVAVDYIGPRLSGHPITQTDSGYEITTFSPEEGMVGMNRVIQLSASDLDEDATSKLTYALNKGSAVCTPIVDVVLKDGKKETTGEDEAAVSRYVIGGAVGNIEFKYHNMNVSRITNVEYGFTDDKKSGWFAQAEYDGQTYNLFFRENFVRTQKTEEGFNLENNTAVSGLEFSTGYSVTSTDHGVEQTYLAVTGANIGELNAPVEPNKSSGVSTNGGGNRSPAAPPKPTGPIRHRPSGRR
jgi:hypothetical protein